jgi:hypothetical protein
MHIYNGRGPSQKHLIVSSRFKPTFTERLSHITVAGSRHFSNGWT